MRPAAALVLLSLTAPPYLETVNTVASCGGNTAPNPIVSGSA